MPAIFFPFYASYRSFAWSVEGKVLGFCDSDELM
ncbi:hypothetical protein SLEP1_g45068 [Rubroshorea leprosula]|uniref:Uncharacterized protein n=1 Tax=Rubroshorea leprosula TaxID=152421 RepID=A0AAV5L0B9_9ROSI|nr:hypothetical protein SLEP1_g39321 [Rubroshorea leprosula]GKV36992.1 hypothetical protein SLEP1_g45068 [Rubroshorea leprosula]